MAEQVTEALRFLNTKSIIHFDYWNVIFDGENCYGTDFGLVLNRSFQLSRDERAFFDRNTHYDFGQFLFVAFRYLVRKYEKLPARKKEQSRERYGFSEDLGR